MSYNWATYRSAKGCTRYGPAGARALMTYLEDRFPLQVSFGICNCRNVSGSSTYSHHAECRAYDEGFVVFVGQTIGIETLELLGPHGAELGIDHLIMNHQPGATSGRGDSRIYSARSPQGRTYTGSHPHKNHNHIGLTRNAGLHLTYAKLVSVLGPINNLNQGDDDVEATKLIQRACNVGGFTDANGNRLKEDGVVGPKTQFATDTWAIAAANSTEGGPFALEIHGHDIEGRAV